MKFRCERDVLAEALGAAGRAATGRAAGALPVLSGVRLEVKGDRLLVTGTDLELTIEQQLEIDGKADGGCVLPARLVTDIVRSLGDPRVEVETSGESVQITAGRSQFDVRAMAYDDYPKLPAPAASAVTLPSGEFAEALRQVVRAASTDDARLTLTGVLLAAEADGLRLVATDSYRLAVRDLSGRSVLSADQKVIVPSRALQELSRLLGSSGDLTLRLGERDATFEVGSALITTRLIETEFPNYRPLIPQAHPNTLTTGREPLLDAIRRVKLLARDAGRDLPVRLDMSADGLRLTAINQELGTASEDVDATYDGTDITVAFNPDYLSAGIEACAGDEITLSTTNELKPAVVRGVGHGDYLYLLMPVRVP